MASVIVVFLMNLTFSRLVSLGGGVSPGSPVSWGCSAGANPILLISEQRNPEVLLLLVGGVVVWIAHCGWVVPGVGSVVSFRFGWRCKLTASLENVNVVLRCILSFSLWVLGSAPLFVLVVVDILVGITSCVASKLKLN